MPRYRVCCVWLGLICLGCQAPARDQPSRLASADLELVVDQAGFQLNHRASGEVLLKEASVEMIGDGIAAEKGSLTQQLRSRGSGQTFIRRFHFPRPDILEVTISATSFVPEIRQRFLDQDEHYYGVWESVHGGNLDNRGASDDFPARQLDRNVNYSNGRAPFYMSSRHYGIYVRSRAKGYFSFAVGGITSFSFAEPRLTYDIIYGPRYADVLSRYNAIAGPPVMPPLWAFGSCWWRDDAHLAVHGATANAQDVVLEDARQLQALRIPASCMWIDRPYGTGPNGWGNFQFDASFPDPKDMATQLRKQGYNLLLWIANKAWQPSRLYRDEASIHALFRDVDGSAVDVGRADAYAVFLRELERFVQLGITGYKVDRGGEAEDAIPDAQINSVNIDFARLAAESMERSHSKDYFIFHRNLNDIGRRYSALWEGDSACSFAGLRAAVMGGLRAGLIDFPMWGSDTGGYLCDRPAKMLLARWLAVSALSPFMEVLIGPGRTPWNDYDAETIAITRKFAQLHHDLIPYIRSLMFEATRSGLPVMRPLMLYDPTAVDLADEYMVGDGLLVAPILHEDWSRSVYLPSGRWLDYRTSSTVYDGPITIPAIAGLDEVPLFVREGAIIPRGDILKGNNSWRPSWIPRLRLAIFPSTREPSRFGYFTGTESRRISVTPSRGGLQIAFDELGADGVMEIYCRDVTAVRRDGHLLLEGRDYRFDRAGHVLTVSFHDRTELVLEGMKGLFGPP